MTFEEAKKKVLNDAPSLQITKSASYNGLYVFVLENKKRPNALLDPICIDSKTEKISPFYLLDDETYEAISRLLK